MWTLEKRFTFEASHQLAYHDGQCRNLHGHSWKGAVIVTGPRLVDDGAKRGMLIDYADLSAIVKPLVAEYLDHHHLNDTLCTHTPTSEFIAQWLYHKVLPELPARLTLAVRIEETATSSCEYSE